MECSKRGYFGTLAALAANRLFLSDSSLIKPSIPDLPISEENRFVFFFEVLLQPQLQRCDAFFTDGGRRALLNNQQVDIQLIFLLWIFCFSVTGRQ